MDRCYKRDRARANDYQPVKMFQEPLWSAERNVNERKAKRTQKLGHLCHSPQSTIFVFSLRARFHARFFALVYCVSRSPRKIIVNCILPLYGITLNVCSPGSLDIAIQERNVGARGGGQLGGAIRTIKYVSSNEGQRV